MEALAEQKYTAYFEGKLRRGHDKDYVCVALSAKLNLSDKKISSLFEKKKVKIKSNLTKDEAFRLAKKFYHCGMILRVSRSKEKVQKLIEQKVTPPVDTIDHCDYRKIFADQCPKAKLSFGCRISLILNLLLTLILPAIYITLVLFVIYGLYMCFTVILPETPEVNRGIYYQVILKVIPTVLGVILLAFLLKPLLSNYRERPKISLKRSENTQIFELVDGIADYVGCNKPALICINNDVNASASFYGGMKGFVNGKMLLTLGMPLVNGMNAQQLSGVIAHEFGHFTQRGAVRTNFLINSVNAWLYSRSFEDDSWDERIESMREETSVSIWYVTLGIASLGVTMVRYIMRFLFALSIKSSFYLSRQMEFDADSYEVSVAGSEAFKETSLRLRLLNIAQMEVEQINESSYEKSFKLFEDMPSAIADIAEQFDDKTVNDVKTGMNEIQTNVWDRHPADSERIKYAESLDRKGVFLSKAPAKAFFKNLKELNRKVTYNYYDKYLCILNPKECMVENTQIKP